MESLIRHEQITAATCLGIFEDGSPEWHEQRDQPGIITGSMIGTLLGLNQWESPLSLFYKRTGQIDSWIEPSMSMKLGKALEQPILDIFQGEHPDWTVYRTGTWQSIEHSWLRANPDAFYLDEQGELCLIEVKFSRNYFNDEIPPSYRAQMLWYMGCLGIKKGLLVALTDSAYKEIEVNFDQFEFDWMLAEARRFRELLATNTPPNFDGSSSTYEAQRKINPEIDGSEVEIAELLGIGLVNTATRIDELTAELNELKARTLDQMGKAKTAFIDVDGEKFVVAKRQQRGAGAPFIQVEKGAKK
jgi:predicted phage-related endonuclease